VDYPNLEIDTVPPERLAPARQLTGRPKAKSRHPVHEPIGNSTSCILPLRTLSHGDTDPSHPGQFFFIDLAAIQRLDGAIEFCCDKNGFSVPNTRAKFE
jgi:hypothetical protein